MTVFLWVLQVALAAMFAMAGGMKVSQPKEKLQPNMPWTDDFSAGTVKLIGVMELLAAVGLVVPALTGIATWLTPLAATGLVVLMLLAALTHVRRKEPAGIALTSAVLVVAAVVAWGRFGPYAF